MTQKNDENEVNSAFIIRELKKLAKGVKLSEEVMEYTFDENGREFLKGRKVVTKNLAPDLNAIKILMSLDKTDSQFDNMTEEELKEESDKLIKMFQTL